MSQLCDTCVQSTNKKTGTVGEYLLSKGICLGALDFNLTKRDKPVGDVGTQCGSCLS